MVEHSLGKGEVVGPIPTKGTIPEAVARASWLSFVDVELIFSESKKWQKRNSSEASRT